MIMLITFLKEIKCGSRMISKDSERSSFSFPMFVLKTKHDKVTLNTVLQILAVKWEEADCNWQLYDRK